jgi:DNA-binding GntR family transcriptional regulator
MTKHEQIKQRIRELVSDYHPHQQIPSERSLEIVMDASRMTVRKALLSLEQEGFLYRKEGVGTFIAEPSNNEYFTRSGFLAPIFIQQTNRAHSEVLQLKKKKINKRLSIALDLPEGTEVYHMLRIRYLESKPVVYDESYYVASITGELTIENAQFSVLEYLEKTKRLVVHSGYYDFQATMGDEVIRELLQVHDLTPILKINRRMFSQKGEVIDVTFSWVRTNDIDVIIKTDTM